MSGFFEHWGQYEIFRRLILGVFAILALAGLVVVLGAAAAAIYFLGAIVLFFTITSAIPEIISWLYAKIVRSEPKPVTDREKIDKMIGIMNYEGEREKSKGSEGESYIWQRRG